MDELPNELLEYTFAHLDSLEDKLSVLRVSQRWRAIGASPSLWRHVWVDYELVLLLTKHMPHMRLRVDARGVGHHDEANDIKKNGGDITRRLRQRWTQLASVATAVWMSPASTRLIHFMAIVLAGRHLKGLCFPPACAVPLKYHDTLTASPPAVEQAELAPPADTAIVFAFLPTDYFGVCALLPGLRRLIVTQDLDLANSRLDGPPLLGVREFSVLGALVRVEGFLTFGRPPPPRNNNLVGVLNLMPALRVLRVPLITEQGIHGDGERLPVIAQLEHLEVGVRPLEPAFGGQALQAVPSPAPVYEALRFLVVHSIGETLQHTAVNDLLTRAPRLETLEIREAPTLPASAFLPLRSLVIPGTVRDVVWTVSGANNTPQRATRDIIFLVNLPFMKGIHRLGDYATLPLRETSNTCLVDRWGDWDGWRVHLICRALNSREGAVSFETRLWMHRT